MSITINGATNTLTAASGLTIAGNTAVTGALSATGAISTGNTTNISLNESPTESLATIFRQSSTGSAVIGNGIKYGTGGATDSSYSGSWGHSAVNIGSSSIKLQTKTASVVAVGSPVTMTTVAEVTPTGLSVTGTLSATGTYRHDVSGVNANLYLGTLGSLPGVWSINDAGTVYTDLRLDGAVVRINSFSGGSTAITGLLDLSNASSGQIKFPATQNASADANTLDDYEEGTWTPSVGGTATYTTQVGRYTKIGRLVTIDFDLQINLIGTGATGNIFGLPFAAANTGGGASISFFTNLALSANYISGYVATASTTLTLTGTTAAAAGITNALAALGDGARIVGTAIYTV